MSGRIDVERFRELRKAALKAGNLFCDDCGRISPECGFYPMFISGPGSISGLICIDCEAKQRKAVEQKEETNGKV